MHLMVLSHYGLRGEVRVRGRLISAGNEASCVTQMEVGEMDQSLSVLLDPRSCVLLAYRLC